MPRIIYSRPVSKASRQATLAHAANKDARAKKHCDKSARFKNVRLKKPKS